MRLLGFCFLLLTACSDPYAEAEKANTIDAWEGYLKDGHPSLSQQIAAEQQLSGLLVAKARQTHKSADYDAVLGRFPKVSDRNKLVEERAEAAFGEAEAAGTPDAWKKFIADNPKADSILVKKATNMIAVSDYGPMLKIDEEHVDQVNLAENPNGPKDGWGFFAKVTNTGDKTVDYLNLEVRLLDAQGQKLKALQYPIVSKTGPNNMPIQEEYQAPLKPGESRQWEYTTGDVPAGWDKKIDVVAVAIKLAP